MQPGDIIAERYKLDGQIGEGGMASVWRATDQRLERPVAVKFLFPTGKGDEEAKADLVASFRREAKIAAAIRHRNVVEVLDFGTFGDNVPFMVMEVLEGESLGDLLDKEHEFTLDEVITIIGHTLRGVMAVHESGIVHRDLKPENIFLLQERGRYFPKLVDFGISKSLDNTAGPASAIKTVDGLFVGTPQYMSPEQARGIPDIDKRTDIYSLGVIMYETIAGEAPYETEHVGDLLMLIMRGDAPPLIEVAPRAGQEISDVVSKAMQVDRNWRFEDADQMYDALMAAAQRDTGKEVKLSFPPPADKPRSGKTVVGVGQPELRASRAVATLVDTSGETAEAVEAPRHSPVHTPPPSFDDGGVDSGPPQRKGLPWGVIGSAAALLVLAGGGIGYGVLANQRVEPAPSRFIVVETPEDGPAAAAIGAPSTPAAGGGAPALAAVAPEANDAKAGEAPSAERVAAKPKAKKKRKKKVGRAGRLSQAFAEQKAKISPCFDGKLGSATALPKVSIRFKIDEQGKVLSTRVSPDDFRDSPLGSCVEKRSRQMRFDPQPESIAFNIPLTARVGG